MAIRTVWILSVPTLLLLISIRTFPAVMNAAQWLPTRAICPRISSWSTRNEVGLPVGREVRSFIDDGDSLLDRSYLVEDDGTIASAVLVSVSEGKPFIGYVMTLASHKNHGLAGLVTTIALESLAGDGHETVVLYITEGNTPSEALFRSIGAVQVEF